MAREKGTCPMDPQAHEDKFTAMVNRWLKSCNLWRGCGKECAMVEECEQAYQLILNCHDQGHYRAMGAGQKGSNPDNIPTEL